MNNHEHNTVSDADRIRAELEDRLMDQNLEELLGGVSPNPEERKVVAVPIAETVSTVPSPRSAPHRGSWVRPVALLATCAGIALVLFSGFFEYNTSRSQQLAMSHSNNTSSPSASYADDDVQYFGNNLDALRFRQYEALEESHREQASAMREIHGLTTPPGNTNVTSSPASQSISDVMLTESHDRSGIIANSDSRSAADIPVQLRINRQTGLKNQDARAATSRTLSPQSEALPGVSQQAAPSPGGLSYDGKSGQLSKRQITEAQMWKLRVLSDRDEAVSEFTLNQPANDGAGPGPNNLGLEWKYVWPTSPDGLKFDLEATNGSKGVGPGNRGDNYAPIIENDFLAVGDSPLSTFSIDVDTASYSNMRRMLTQNNMLPPPDAVRIEELVNYFNYEYPAPEGEHPFSVNVETASCPWRPESRLVRIALKGEEIPFEERPASNLVFLLDVSGSMKPANKLPLLKSCFKMMVDYLTENDTISIVVYASGTRMVLPPTTGDQKAVIMESLEQLQAGGSTNGAGGIQLAYQTATENFIPGGINRVILATDGDFNVGITSQGDLHRLIEEKAKSNVFLTTLGFGFGNLQDNTIELLADKGNGNYAYIDSIAEGRKVLIDEMGSTLNTIAKNVKIQVEFNPLKVAASRLIGYENRILPHEHFNDDTKDAGEIGAGHTVTAFYEIIPAGEEQPLVENQIDELEFQRPQKPSKLAREGHLMLVKLRYLPPNAVIGDPNEDPSKLIRVPVTDSGHEFTQASRDFQFAASVASFGMLLRNSKYAGQASYKNVLEQAQATLGETPESYRAEFVELVKQADRLAGQGRK